MRQLKGLIRMVKGGARLCFIAVQAEGEREAKAADRGVAMGTRGWLRRKRKRG